MGSSSGMRLVACLIVRDEEGNLERCLSSLRGIADEICLVDTGSRDGTLAVARRCGAVVAESAWADDFSVPRNACLDLARGRADWVLQIDADEELDRSCGEELRRCMEEAPACRLVEVALLDGTAHPGRVALPRLFRLDPRIRYRRALHESVLESLEEAGLGDPAPSGIRLVHHGYKPDAISEKSKRDRNARILRKVRERGDADAYDLYKLGTTLLPFGADAGERSGALRAAWDLASRTDPAESARWPWLPVLARALAQDLAWAGRLQEAWDALAEIPSTAPSFLVLWSKADLLLRSGRPEEALASARDALAASSRDALSASGGKERGEIAYLASRCARRLGRDHRPFLEEAAAAGIIEARCDLILAGIEKGEARAWKDLDIILRSHAGHPSALIAASEAARSQGDRSTSDLLLQQAGQKMSEPALRAKGRLWMRAWLSGSSPAFDLPPIDAENAAATGLDRVLRGEAWRPDPFISRQALLRSLGEILQALLGAGRHQAVRAFAENARGRDPDLPGISELVEGA